MVSAVRVGGRRLHELARQGVEVEREARPVTVHELAVSPVDAEPGVYQIEVTCSSGTYIRSLAADIGSALDGGAHLRKLRRVAIGSFSEEEAQPVNAPILLSMADALRDYPSVTIDDALARMVGNGQVLSTDDLAVTGEGPWAVLGSTGADIGRL